MTVRDTHAGQGWQLATRLGLVAVLFAGFFMAKPGLADDLSECMAELMGQASDSTTIGELRLLCRERTPDDAGGAHDK